MTDRRERARRAAWDAYWDEDNPRSITLAIAAYERALAQSDEGVRSVAEQVRVQERLLIRGNTLGSVVAAVLSLLADGREFSAEEIGGYERELCAWTADVRAIASEEAP